MTTKPARSEQPKGCPSARGNLLQTARMLADSQDGGRLLRASLEGAEAPCLTGPPGTKVLQGALETLPEPRQEPSPSVHPAARAQG